MKEELPDTVRTTSVVGKGGRGLVLPWLGAIIATLSGYFILLGNWPVWQSIFLLPDSPGAWFPDIYAVLAASDLHAAGYDPYGKNPLGTTHYYPRSWFALADLGLDRSHAHWVGLLLGGIFLAVSLIWLRPKRYRDAVFIVLCMLSPPLTLGFQRANADNILYVMMVMCSFFLASRLPVVRIGLGGVLIMSATLLKFYPIVGAVVCWWNEAGLKRWLVVVLFTVMIAFFGISLWEDYQRIRAVINLGSMADGFLYSFGVNFDPIVRWIIWVGIPVCGVAAWAGWIRVSPYVIVPSNDVLSIGFMLGGFLLLGCFSMGNNFAYRLVFILLMIPFWWRLRDSKETIVRWLAKVSLGVTLLLLWRDGLAAICLGEMQRVGWVDLHNYIVGWHRQALAAIQWLWCALVICLMCALLRHRLMPMNRPRGRVGPDSGLDSSIDI